MFPDEKDRQKGLQELLILNFISFWHARMQLHVPLEKEGKKDTNLDESAMCVS